MGYIKHIFQQKWTVLLTGHTAGKVTVYVKKWLQHAHHSLGNSYTNITPTTYTK